MLPRAACAHTLVRSACIAPPLSHPETQNADNPLRFRLRLAKSQGVSGRLARHVHKWIGPQVAHPSSGRSTLQHASGASITRRWRVRVSNQHLAKQLRQLSDVGGDAARFVAPGLPPHNRNGPRSAAGLWGAHFRSETRLGQRHDNASQSSLTRALTAVVRV